MVAPVKYSFSSKIHIFYTMFPLAAASTGIYVQTRTICIFVPVFADYAKLAPYCSYSMELFNMLR